MDRYRVLHVVEASTAGIGRHVVDQVAAGVACGDVVDVAYGARRADRTFLGALPRTGARQVMSFDTSRRPGVADVRVLADLRRFVAAHGPYDIVHGHGSKGGGVARLLPSSAATVYTPHAFVTQSPDLGWVARAVYGTAERLLARRTDGLIVVAPEEHDHARGQRLRPRSVELIPNGIPLRPLPARAVARERLGIDASALVVGFVGRLSAQKGLDRLLDSFGAVHAATGAQLVVVGVGDDAAALREQCARLQLDRVVRWVGELPGQDAMPAFDVLAVPSRYEGFPYVVLEALWAGVPVLATDVAGATTVLGDGRAGRLCGNSTEAIGRGLIELLTELEQPDRREAMSAAAREVVQRYSVDAMVDATRALYGRVVEHRVHR